MKAFLLGIPVALSWLGLVTFASRALVQRTTTAGQNAPTPSPSGAFVPRLHDPSTIVKCKDEYWLFSTGVGITSRHSKDLVNWNVGPCVFASSPAWSLAAVPDNRGDFWAPDIIRLAKGFFLYYSVSSWGKNRSAIGLTTTPTLDQSDPAHAWSDRGMVLRSDGEDAFNAIDPSVMLDRDGRLWLAFGSYWTGIKLVELNPETGLRISASSPVYSLAWNSSIEAACLYQHEHSYYLLVNWGQCCLGARSTYQIRVGRSERITGPYLDRQGKDMMQGGGSLVLASEGYRIGPGHAGILKDGAKEYLSYHFYHAERRGRSMLEVAPLGWSKDGWPEVGSPLPVHQVSTSAE